MDGLLSSIKIGHLLRLGLIANSLNVPKLPHTYAYGKGFFSTFAPTDHARQGSRAEPIDQLFGTGRILHSRNQLVHNGDQHHSWAYNPHRTNHIFEPRSVPILACQGGSKA